MPYPKGYGELVGQLAGWQINPSSCLARFDCNLGVQQIQKVTIL